LCGARPAPPLSWCSGSRERHIDAPIRRSELGCLERDPRHGRCGIDQRGEYLHPIMDFWQCGSLGKWERQRPPAMLRVRSDLAALIPCDDAVFVKAATLPQWRGRWQPSGSLADYPSATMARSTLSRSSAGVIRKWSMVRHSVGHQSTQRPQRMQLRSSMIIAAA
jgi:hypothetical protein